MNTYSSSFDGITVEVDGDRIAVRGIDEQLSLTPRQACLLASSLFQADQVIRSNREAERERHQLGRGLSR